MIIIDQRNTTAVFSESGNMICIEKTSEKMSDYYGIFSDGNNSGDRTTFPYAIVFYNSNGKSCVMGVYQDLKIATDKFDNLVRAYQGRSNWIYWI